MTVEQLFVELKILIDEGFGQVRVMCGEGTCDPTALLDGLQLQGDIMDGCLRKNVVLIHG